jgi:hypothetical protein
MAGLSKTYRTQNSLSAFALVPPRPARRASDTIAGGTYLRSPNQLAALSLAPSRTTVLAEALLGIRSKEDIAKAIVMRIGLSRPSAWRIGLTHYPFTRKAFWEGSEDVRHWTLWECRSLSDAQDIEAAFIRRGMKGGTGGDLSPRYPVFVYIF